MKKRMLSLLCALALCLGLLPTTALAAGTDAPDKLYVGNQQVIVADTITYWSTNDSGELTRVENATDNSSNWNVKYDPYTATLTLNEAKISGSYNQYNNPFTAGIYAKGSSNQSVALTIELIGTNTITGSYGIYVEAQQGGTVGTNASLLIQNSGNDGSLEVSGSSYGIYVKSGTGNASLTIKDASVVASSSSTLDGYAGVCVQSSSDATSSPQLSLAVNGGSLTTSASEGNDGIQFYVGAYGATSATTSLSVTNNAIVDARTGGISASGVSVNPNVNIGSTGSSGGIVWNGAEGTVYGDVTLDESLTIGEDETLTIPQGSTLNGNSNLTNNGTVTIENGGTLNGSDAINNTGTINVENGGNLGGTPTGTVVYAPTITTQPAGQEVTVGQTATFTVSATGENMTYQWQYSNDNGTNWNDISGATGNSYTTDAATLEMNNYQYQCVVSNSAGSVTSATATLTVNAVSVTGVSLDKTALSLRTGESAALTATVAPADATNPAVTWSSDKPEIARVENGTVTAVAPGTATITVTTADGNFTASCTVTVTRPVTGVTLDKTELALFTGESAALTATVAPADATNQAVSWTSDNEAVATVTDGKVTAVAPGTATITVTTQDGSYTAVCRVTVTQSVYHMTAAPAVPDFGSACVGYARPGAITVTITNTGNRPLTLDQPASTANFEVGALSATELPVGGTATFTVQPKAGLAVGAYQEEIWFSASHAGTVVKSAVSARFTVAAASTPGTVVTPTAAPAGSTTAVAAGATPQTGDASSPVLWLGLLAASGLVLAGILLYRRKQKKNREN